MTPLDLYLDRYFLNVDRLAAASGLSRQQLQRLLSDRLIPGASYVLVPGSVTSYVFGALPATAAASGEYFHPATRAWIARASRTIDELGYERAYTALQARFTANMTHALAALNASLWPLQDAFAADGTVLEGLHARIGSMWDHFLHGTFGLCVANPVSELEIARKEVLQEKLTALSASGTRRDFAEAEVPALLELIDAYATAAMPFSPVEYARSSRKRLVDDLKAHLTGAAETQPAGFAPALPDACGWQ
jgi:hypothetical protein